MTRPTLGVLMPSAIGGYHQQMWTSLDDAAEARGANLICFTGGPWKRPGSLWAHQNVLYDRVGECQLDGLAISSTLSSPHGDLELLERFCQRFHPIPTITIGAKVPGIPAVVTDSYHGLFDLMVHMIEGHAYRQIAFIRGPHGNAAAQERYRAYGDALTAYGIPFDPDLVADGNFRVSSGAAAAALLNDERKVAFEAIVAANDEMAIGALKALWARGIHTPADVAVAGFDGIERGRAGLSPLTTVLQPFDDLGQRAIDLLLAQMDGKDVPEETVIPAQLVVRQSCGCLILTSAQVVPDQIESMPPTRSIESALTEHRTELVTGVIQVARAGGHEIDPACVDCLLDALAELLNQRDEPLDGLKPSLPANEARKILEKRPGPAISFSLTDNVFLQALSTVLRQTMIANGDLTVWQTVIAALRHWLLPCYSNDERAARVERLWQQSHIVIGQSTQQAQLNKSAQILDQSRTLNRVQTALVNTLDLEDLTNKLIDALRVLDIPSCYLATYEPSELDKGERGPALDTRQAQLVLAYDGGKRIALGPKERATCFRQLLSRGTTSFPKRRGLIACSLTYNKEEIGFVLFEAGPRHGSLYSILRICLSNTLKKIQLFVREQQARAMAEKADQLKSRLLANVSHELRHPLDVILGYTHIMQWQLEIGRHLDSTETPRVLEQIGHIQTSAEHQRRLVNDLLDLSLAEVDELYLETRLVDTVPFLEDIFHTWTDSLDTNGQVTWHLQLPGRLPPIEADPTRLRQVLLNLLSNAKKFTEHGEVVFGAEVSPPHLHVWVQDSGIGISPELQAEIFEPFVTVHDLPLQRKGIGLGLSITRRLVALHGGRMTLDSQPGEGSTFHVFMPLPNLNKRLAVPSLTPEQPASLLVLGHDEPAPEIVELSQRQGLEIRRLRPGEEVARLLAEVQPAALAWDLDTAGASDWVLLQQLREHPQLRCLPFILYNNRQEQEMGPALAEACTSSDDSSRNHRPSDIPRLGITNVMVKSIASQTLLEAIESLCPVGNGGSILIIDDEPAAIELHRNMVRTALPGHVVRTAADGAVALAMMENQVPGLVVLDLVMPKMDGFQVLKQMRANETLRKVPVLVLTGRALTLEDVKRFERYSQVTVQSKGVLSEDEMVDALQRTAQADLLPPHTGALVKRAIAYIHQNYDQSLSRQEMAQVIGTSSNYLTVIFRRELGLPPLKYLNRYRVARAKDLLRDTNQTVTAIAFQVGFTDPAYFSRVFRRETGLSPLAYRKNP